MSNFLFIRLQFLISPLFFKILTIILFIIYKIIFDTHLCDDGLILYNLKVDLTMQTAEYRTANINYEFYTDLFNQASNRPTDQRDYTVESEFIRRAHDNCISMRNIYDNINEIIRNIKRIEPTFRSPIMNIAYPRIAG